MAHQPNIAWQNTWDINPGGMGERNGLENDVFGICFGGGFSSVEDDWDVKFIEDDAAKKLINCLDTKTILV